jgi:hypothetical protein
MTFFSGSGSANARPLNCSDTGGTGLIRYGISRLGGNSAQILNLVPRAFAGLPVIGATESKMQVRQLEENLHSSKEINN